MPSERPRDSEVSKVLAGFQALDTIEQVEARDSRAKRVSMSSS